MAAHEEYELRQMQSLPLEAKIRMTQQRIQVWYESWQRFDIVNKATGKERFEVRDMRDRWNEPELKENEYVKEIKDGQVYVSFSGGKDSTVLMHIVREMYPDVEALFVNTGLEYPEIQKFVKTFDNVTILRPEMRFDEVIKTYGYPLISKEVSQRIYEYNRGELTTFKINRWEENKTGDGTAKSERYDLRKWKPLRDSSDIRVTHKCCDVMKKGRQNPLKKRQGKSH